MREIKFRAWDETEKTFWFFGLQETLSRHLTYIGSFDIKIARGVKQQYTGLKDKNYKEIYEGDIVKYTYGCYKEFETTEEVVWGGYSENEYSNKIECFMLGNNYILSQICNDSYGEVEIVGNIFEN